jgi:serralysin
VPAVVDGLSVIDDAGQGVITTTLSVQYGILTLGGIDGLEVDGNGTDQVTLSGTPGAINSVLAEGGVTYQAPEDFFGPDTLRMFTDDHGNTGTGGPLTDTDQVTIHVNTYREGTDGDDSFDAHPGNEMIVARLGLDSIAFDFALVDATVTYRNNLVIIDGPSSHTVLSGFETYVFTDGTVHNGDSDRLVDDLFYYSRYHDVWNAHTDADTHYHTTGWHEGRDPNAFFDTDLYLALNPDVKKSGLDPLLAFDQFGWREGDIPSTAFDPARYLASYPDVAAANRDPLEHFLRHGAEENRLPHVASAPLAANGFDFAYYLLHNPDVAAAGVDPLQHFETVGWHEGRKPNALFDPEGYLATYTDVAASGINPLDHYHVFGWHEGRDPSVDFDTSAYLAAYPDVAAANRDPLAHYLQFGIHEGRSTFADGVWG